MNVDQDNQLTGTIIGAAIAVHREFGPGVHETAYEHALSLRLRTLGISHQCQKPLPLRYREHLLECGFRLDLVVEERLPIEVKAVEVLLPVHEAQILTYMRIGRHPLGLLLNFEVPVLREGIRRMVLTTPPPVLVQSYAEVCEGFDALSAEVLHAALKVHQALGLGLLRSAYEECLCYELEQRAISFEGAHRVPLRFEGCEIGRTAEVPLLVAGKVPVFCLSVSSLSALHEARLLARLRQGDWPYGILLNFNEPTLKQGVRRITRA